MIQFGDRAGVKIRRADDKNGGKATGKMIFQAENP